MNTNHTRSIHRSWHILFTGQHLILGAALLFSPAFKARAQWSQAEVAVRFSPEGHPTDAVVQAIHHAKSRLLIQAYEFTSAPIAQAVLDAQGRGVAIEVIVDKSQEKERSTQVGALERSGIRILEDYIPAIAHNKVMLIDGEGTPYPGILITGSFNFTTAAEKRNAENCLFLRKCPELFQQYLDYFHSREAVSQPFPE